jgi:hypothetical protein
MQGDLLQMAVEDFFKAVPQRQLHSEPAPA